MPDTHRCAPALISELDLFTQISTTRLNLCILPQTKRRNVVVFMEGFMRTIQLHWQKVFAAVAFCLVWAVLGTAADDPTKEEMKQFLLSAKVVNSKHTGKGITDPWRLTLSDGTITHDGGFQAIDEHKPRMQYSNGTVELNFVDSYKYNIAAYILAEMVGMDNMIPVYVERKWKGQAGSLSWWLPVKMDEA